MKLTNLVILKGNLGQDPRFMEGGKGASFSLAVKEVWGTGEDQQERTDWFQIVVWSPVSNPLSILRKGDRVRVGGKLRTREYTEKDTDKKRTVVEVWASEVEFQRVKAWEEKAA